MNPTRPLWCRMRIFTQNADPNTVTLPKLFIEQCQSLLGEDNVITDTERLRVYECDALPAYRRLPALVALPETVEQVQAILGLCAARGVAVVARGAGTGVSGGRFACRRRNCARVKQNEPNSGDRSRQPHAPACNPASAISPFPKPPNPSACITRPILPRKLPAASAATSPKTPAACIA